MKAEERLASAVHAADPDAALRVVIHDLVREGWTQRQLGTLLEAFLLRLRAEPGHQEADEDSLLDLMDALTGFCHPSAQLLPDGPTDGPR